MTPNPTSTGPPASSPTVTSRESMVDIGDGVVLWLNCMGQSDPVILMEGPGPGSDSSPWAAIQQKLSQTIRVCRYDRTGTGKSTGEELKTLSIPPRTEDLQKLLDAASVRPPYIMVGYSFGGAIVLRYAHEHLDRVAGLVLVEGATESILARYENEEPPLLPETGYAPPLNALPLVVVTIDTSNYALPDLPNLTPEESLKLWLGEQAGLTKLSTRGTQVFVTNTNHYSILDIHTQAVIDAIMSVMEAAR